MKIFFVSAIFLTCVRPIVAYNHSVLDAIQTAILTGYNTNHRPSDSTNISINLGLSHVTRLDTIEQKLGLVGFLLLNWFDPRLVWDPSAYDGTILVQLTSNNIWVPPLVLSNAAEKVSIIRDDGGLQSVPLRIFADGNVAWLVPANFESYCELNVQYYPFDQQTCTIIVSAWAHYVDEVRLTSLFGLFAQMEDGLNTDLFVENGEWDLVSNTKEDVSRQLLQIEMSAVKFTITFQRKYSYYLLNMLLPVMFLSLLSLFVFVLPAQSGERVGYSLTILLSLSVVMTLVSDNIPRTSTNTCLLSVYLLAEFILSSLVTLVVVLNLKLHFWGEQGHKTPLWVNKITRNFLARITCWKTNKVDVEESFDGDAGKLTPTSKDSVKEKDVIFVRSKPSSPSNENVEEDYSYEDIALMLDKICSVIFCTVNFVTTVTLMLTIAT